MSLIEQQLQLQTRLEDLRKERSRIDSLITKAASELHEFEKTHGNVILREQRMKEWKDRETEREAMRATKEWQDWRERLFAKTTPSQSVRSEPKPDFIFNMNDGPLMAHVMHKAGIFSSVTEAKKNGWGTPIQSGTYVVGKNKTRISITKEVW